MNDQIISQFVEELIQAAGLVGMPEAFKKDYTEKIVKEVEWRLGRRVILDLPEESLAAYNKLSTDAKTTPTDILLFFNENLADFPKILAAELEKFKADFIKDAKDMEKLQAAKV